MYIFPLIYSQNFSGKDITDDTCDILKWENLEINLQTSNDRLGPVRVGRDY